LLKKSLITESGPHPSLTHIDELCLQKVSCMKDPRLSRKVSKKKKIEQENDWLGDTCDGSLIPKWYVTKNLGYALMR
jgi:hypothetical protein